jgi:Saxitoxin biosynthesis operon protein SxtJ
MAALHEDFARADEIKGSSDRAFGLTVGGILLAIALWRTWAHAFGGVEAVLSLIGIGLLGFGALAPRLLAPLNRLWIRLGLLLGKVVSPIPLGIIYLTTIVPIGPLLRAFGKDPLHLRTDPQATSYWIRRDPRVRPRRP